MSHLYFTKMTRVAESTSKVAIHSIKWNVLNVMKAANVISNNNVDNHAR